MNKMLKGLQEAKQKGFVDGVWQGLSLGINLTIIAYYNVFGIGRKRYARLKPELDRLINEIRQDDPIQAEKHITEAFKRIK